MSIKNILFIAGYGGPSLDYTLPLVKKHGKLHVFVPDSLPAAKVEMVKRHADVCIYSEVQNESELEAAIVSAIEANQIHAAVTLDEFSINAVSRAAIKTGLRGAGPSTPTSRHKWLMRQAFEKAGLNNPRYVRVQSLEELKAGLAEVGLPAVLKMAEGAGSIGHTVFHDTENVEQTWANLLELISGVHSKRTVGAIDSFASADFILESFIEATTDSWYDESGYGDLISVEGLVVDGKYYPIALTSKLPMMPPFTEVAQITPCLLSLEKQQKIIDYARRAVDSLQLSTCGTHTEIKLQANGELCMVESAARLPGAVITRQIHDAFDISLIELLTQALLDSNVQVPPTQFEQVKYAAGPLGLVPLNSQSLPWSKYPKLNKQIDFSPYLEDGVSYEVQWSGSSIEGENLRQYDAKLGAMNYIAIFYFLAPDIPTLVRTQRKMMDIAESIFNEHELLAA